ncbi:MAG TPA: ATP-binding protein [Labilithrix sp.]|nr:ATP-binding protein [Labilithrix sp.]
MHEAATMANSPNLSCRTGCDAVDGEPELSISSHVTRRNEEVRANDFFYSVFENVEDGIAVCDTARTRMLFNRASREILGFANAAVCIDRWAEAQPPYSWATQAQLTPDELPLFRALNGETVDACELVIVAKDGAPRTVLANARPLRDGAGKMLGALATLRDITETKRAAEESRRQQALLKYILNFVPHSIFWKDRESRFLGANATFLATTVGLDSAAEVVGKTDVDFFEAADARHFRATDLAVMESGETLVCVEDIHRLSDGQTRTLLTSKVPLRSEDGEIIGVVGIFADITERKQMERALEEATRAAQAAARAKSEFLAIVSHELRTPLTLVLGPIDVLLGKAKELPAEVVSELECVRRNAMRLYSLVSDILDFTKLEAGRVQVDWERVELVELVAQIVADAMSTARARGIELSFVHSDVAEAIPSDRRKLEKIILNLLGNALKFTPPGGTVVVALARVDDQIEISVTDSGIGISKERQYLLFERFGQVDSSIARRYEGTGLGLALVKELTVLMGGTVGVESEPEKGSRFFVRFARTADRAMCAVREAAMSNLAPRQDPRAAGQRALYETASDVGGPLVAKQSQPKTTAEGGPRVLVIDDNRDMRNFVAEVLSDEYSVVTAVDGESGLRVAKRDRFDAIVSDVMMPALDGLELVAILKQDPALRTIPVILLTARASREELVDGLVHGADDYLGKPFTPSELKARVKAAVRLHRALRELEATLEALRRTQAELVQSEKMAAVGTLIAGLSHELNNPLAAISVHTEMLSKFPGSEVVARRAVPVIRTQTERCAHLVRMLLDFSRRKEHERERTTLAAILQQLWELAWPTTRQRGVALKFECSVDESACVCVNRQQIETALLNLVTNAVAATNAGGIISIRAERLEEGPAGVAEIAVVDTGDGIPKDVLPRIFDPFFTTKPTGQGTGIGLALARKVVEEHGGTLRIESEIGRGTSAILRLPLAS